MSTSRVQLQESFHSVAKRIGDQSKTVESRIQDESHGVQDTLGKVYVSAEKAHAVGDISLILKHFLRFKNDSRVLLDYYRDSVVAVSFEGNEDSDALSTLSALDQEMIDHETSFKRYHSSSQEEQMKSMIDALNFRDQSIFRICSTLLSQLGIEDAIGYDSSLQQESALGSLQLPQFVHLFQSFRALGKNVRSLMERQKDDPSVEVMQEKNNTIKKLENDLRAKINECNTIQNRYETIASVPGRQQTISRQQDEIMRLELVIRDKEKEISNQMAANRRLLQQVAQKEDIVKARDTQLEDVRGSYEKDIKALKPVIEEQSGQMKKDQRDIAEIRNDITLGMSRMLVADKMIDEAQQHVVSLEGEKMMLERVLEHKNRVIQSLEKEVARQGRINLVAVAAKVKYEKLSDVRWEKILSLEETIRELEMKVESQQGEMMDMEAYIDELQEMVANAEEQSKLLEDQLNVQIATLAAREQRVTQLRKQVEKFNDLGMTEERRLEFKSLEMEINDEKEKYEELEKKYKATAHRVHQLQGELMAAKMGNLFN